ncbi:MAG: 50S ribosomal protein L9 [Planctomycetes bacterium]|nr:50S ribosomal protein L9 [Planctomycetota bacterium]MBU1518032.1 50S ribosomal protein L9 [Planctomycetota bacterium]MBU2458210.1 50S ribosomal protein L9 [Planctomycetota bacterium]MBU2596945.1 50S ribosomal protein L9 [Planctomycetota bacterium]
MKVLLCEDIETLGWYGDVVDVRQGYARNYLLPQRLATIPTEAKIKAMADEKAKRAEQREVVVENFKKAADAVNGAEVVLAAKANEQGHLFGSVTEKEIAANLRQQGFEVADKFVHLDERIKEIGERTVKLRFTVDVTASVKVIVVPEMTDLETTNGSESQTKPE